MQAVPLVDEVQVAKLVGQAIQVAEESKNPGKHEVNWDCNGH
jgi:hypothetical protein